MTCQDARELLSGLVDDALTDDERRRLLEHLATCNDCARERERLAATVALLQSVTPARAPAGFVDRVLTAARPTPWYRRLVRAVLLPWPVKLPIEAAVIVLLGIGVTYLYQRTPELREAARMPSPAEHQTALQPATTDEKRASAPVAANVDSLRSKDSAARSSERKAVTGSQKTEAVTAGRAFDAEADSKKRDAFRDKSNERERDAPARPDTGKAPDALDRDVGALERRQEAPAPPPAAAMAPPASSTLSTPAPPVATPSLSPPSSPKAAAAPPPTASAPSAGRDSVSELQAKEQAARNLVTPGAPPAPQAPSAGTLARKSLPPAPTAGAAAEQSPRQQAPATSAPAKQAPPEQAPIAGAPAEKALPDVRAESRLAKMRRAPDVIGRLSVPNRGEAEKTVLELAARNAGTLVDRRLVGDTPVLTFDVPRASYPAFARDLAAVGRFTPDREPGAIGDIVEIVITLE